MSDPLTTRIIVGSILWWSEGTKSRKDKRWKNTRSYPIELTNTNPAIIQIFMDFIREDLKAPENRIHIQLQVHQGDDVKALESYWSTLTGVDLSRFNKTIIRPKGSKVGKTKGTCKIRFVDKQTYLKLEGMLYAVQKNLYIDPQKTLKSLPHYDFVD